jgi:hypothetical protein
VRGPRPACRAGAAGLAVLALAAVLGCGEKAAAPPAEEAARAGKPFERSLLGYVARVYPGNHEQCVGATRTALRKLGLEVTDETGAIFEKRLQAESQDGTSIALQVTEVSKDSTRVSIKVGYLLGNPDAARRIHSEIEAELAGRAADALERQRKWGRLPEPAPGAGTPTPPAGS